MMKYLNKYFKKNPLFFSCRGLDNIDSINEFLYPPKKWLNNPFLFYDMDKAVNQIVNYPKNKPILIHGDCDADGVSACGVLTSYLSKIGYNIESYIPNRTLEGHIVSKKAIDFAHSIGCSLIITCDIGMSAKEEVEYAKSKSIKFIITDHHKINIDTPNAFAIINPWLEENKDLCFKDYSGSGVAFKLCHAINKKLSLEENLIYKLMSIAVIGIISDKVSIKNENRYISLYGYNQIKSGNNLGISLINNRVSKNKAEININKIVQIMNMATKIDDPSIGVKLLTTDNPVQANKYANIILSTFKKNKLSLTNAIQSAIRQTHAQNYKKNKCIFIISDFDSAYNGVIASRLAFNFSVPCAVISRMNDTNFKGSCRSVGGIDLLSILNLNKNIFLNSGGHPMAAGFIISEQNIEKFKKIFFEYMISQTINMSDKKNRIDGEISFTDINSDLISMIKKFRPFGSGNEVPIFKTKNVFLVGSPSIFGADNSSIQFMVEHNKVTLNAIGFNLINKFEILLSKNKLDIEYSILIDNDNINLKVHGIN